MNTKNAQVVFKWIYRLTNVVIRNPSALTGRYKYIFILSHMRGYTSLLSHILGGHPEISGYFELHQRYRGSFDLFLMRIRVANGMNYQVRGSYLLDKVLHSKWFLSPKILQREDVFTIFTIRKPEGSLKSLMYMREKLGFPKDSLEYYIERLDSLKDMSHIPYNRLYLDGELLVDNTNPVLESLRSFLQLGENISASYSTFKFTGEGGFGDRSEFIKQGKIVKDRDAHSEFHISPDVLQKATEAYDETRHVLIENCLSI